MMAEKETKPYLFLAVRMDFTRDKDLSEFHESYYDHSCTVVNKKDVLKADIRGNSFGASLKRWWYGLFLVSYGDERARVYYSSSEAMRLDRIRQFRNFKGRIHPLSKFRSFWDGLMMWLVIINKFMVHHNMSVVYGKVCRYFYFIGPIIEVIILMDVYINFKTGYADHDARRIVIEHYAGTMRYCSTKLFLHVASAIPLQWLLILRYGAQFDCDLCKTNYFVLTLRIIAIFGLFRVYECSSYWTREWDRYEITATFRFIRVFVLCIITLLYCHDVASKIALMIMINEGEISHNSYWSKMLYKRFVSNNPTHSYTLFLMSILRATNSALRINFSSTIYNIDRCVIIIAYATVSFFFVWGLSEVYSFLSRSYFVDSYYHRVRASADNMIRCHQLPEEISIKVKMYYDLSHVHMDVIERRNLLVSALPGVLKRESALACYRRYVRRVPYFAEWLPAVTEQLVLMLTRETYLSGDLVAEGGVASEGLAVVAAGELAVFGGGTERGHLIDGDFFGELALVTDRELRTSTVYAITPCLILQLDKMAFRKFMRGYPNLFMDLKTKLQNKFDNAIQS